jgi:hypothetical protein
MNVFFADLLIVVPPQHLLVHTEVLVSPATTLAPFVNPQEKQQIAPTRTTDIVGAIPCGCPIEGVGDWSDSALVLW